MHSLFADCFNVALPTLVAIHGAESGTCDKTNVCSAIKALENKLDRVVALVTPPGRFELTRLYCIFLLLFFRLFLLLFFSYQAHHMSLICFTVAVASSCKELHDKHK